MLQMCHVGATHCSTTSNNTESLAQPGKGEARAQNGLNLRAGSVMYFAL
jgi:hypothetical protein